MKHQVFEMRHRKEFIARAKRELEARLLEEKSMRERAEEENERLREVVRNA